MREWRGSAVLFAAVSLCAFAATTGAGEEAPTRRIGSAEVAEVAEFLPESIRRWVERGDFVLKVGELRYTPRWDRNFLSASEANRGRFTLDARLNVVEVTTGAQPAYVFGFPFPEIDPQAPDAGARVLWNRWFSVHKRSQIRLPLKIHLLEREGLIRTVESRLETLAYYGREGRPLSNPEGTEWREIVRFVSPTFIEGTTSLTWRYFHERPDSLWFYLPIIRRIRQATSTNRSDALAGSDVVLDDGLVWAGKNQSFTWKLLGSQDLLVLAASLDPQPLHAGETWESETEWVSGEDYRGVVWGYQRPDWKGAPWAPVEHYWVKRPVWVVEGNPRDRYYSYGRQIFYVDRETYHAYAKIVHTPAGEYWKTVLTDLGMSCAPSGERCYPAVALSLVVDDLRDRATVTSVVSPDNPVRIHTPMIRAEDFTVQGLLKKGK